MNLRIQGFLDADPPLDPGLASLDLSHDLLNVLQLIAALPEYSCGKPLKEAHFISSSLMTDFKVI